MVMLQRIGLQCVFLRPAVAPNFEFINAKKGETLHSGFRVLEALVGWLQGPISINDFSATSTIKWPSAEWPVSNVHD